MNEQNFVIQYLGFLLHNYRVDIVQLLNASGYPVNDATSEGDLQTVVVTAVAENEKFKNDLAAFMEAKAREIVGGEQPKTFNNANGMPTQKVWQNVIGADDEDIAAYTNNLAPTTTSSTSKNTLGGALNGLLTTDTIKGVINSGLGIWSASINNKAQQDSYNSAIELEKIKLQTAQAQAAAAAAGQYGTKASTGMPTWGWILIGVAGLGLVVTVIIVATRKKK